VVDKIKEPVNPIVSHPINPPVPHLPIGTTPPVEVRHVSIPPSNPDPPVSAKVSAATAERLKLKEVRKAEILKIMAETIEEYGAVGNIPVDHIYHSLGNEYRSLG